MTAQTTPVLLGHKSPAQMKREVIYVRVSTFDQSCERQIADLTEFAARAEYDVLDIHKETNSGTKTNPHPRNQVMTLVQARKIDAVLVGELGQWSRFTQDLLDTQNQLNRTCGINATESPTRALKIAPRRYFALRSTLCHCLRIKWNCAQSGSKSRKKRHQSTLCGRTQYSDSISKRRPPPIRWELSYVGIREWHNRKPCATYRNVVTSPAVDRSAGI
jgi:hypothetical protein